jgi:hypothetical protein
VNSAERSARVVLRDVRDERGTRYLAARRRDDGGVLIEGHDLGRGVEAFGPGFSEYEWSWVIGLDVVPAALAALGGQAGDDLLQLLRTWSIDHGGVDPGSHLKNSGVPVGFWSHVGD